MRRMANRSAVALLLGLLHNSAPLTAETAETVRGITISTHRGGQEWGSDVMGPTFDKVKVIGANWVAIHPYASIRSDGSVVTRHAFDGEAPESIRRPIREAHARGLRILIKPHLAYWGSPFAWRGEIEFHSDEEWRRFFSTYGDWIASLAAAAHDADAFAVGTELDRTVTHESAWRAVIARVRSAFKGRLTYAANWTDYETVPFWDALDTIGVQAYFPIAEIGTTDNGKLEAGWSRVMAALRSFAAQHDRKVLFTELGYNRSFAAPSRPWDAAVDGPEALPIAQACLRVALAAVEGEPLVEGAFLWKWFPEPRPMGRDFQLADPAMAEVIAGAWR